MQGSKRDFHYIDRTHREKLAIVPVFAVAPLAVIGGVMALLLSGAPLGFVAILGVLALIDILVRNSTPASVTICTSLWRSFSKESSEPARLRTSSA